MQSLLEEAEPENIFKFNRTEATWVPAGLFAFNTTKLLMPFLLPNKKAGQNILSFKFNNSCFAETLPWFLGFHTSYKPTISS